MKVVFDNAREFRAMLSPLYNIVDEALLKYEDGLLSRVLGSTKNIGVKLYIPSKEFEEISFGEGEKVGVNLDMFFKMTKKIGAEKITLETEANKLKILLQTEGKKRRFVLPLMDIPEVFPKDIVADWNAHVRIDAKVLKNLLEDLSPAGDTLLFRVRNSVFEVVVEENTKAAVEFTEGIEVYEIEGEGESMFNIEYVKKALKPASGSVLLHIGQKPEGDYLPLRVDYEMGKGQITTWVAPNRRPEY